MLTKLGRRMGEHSENFNKDLENIKKEPIRAKEYNNEIKSALKGINNIRLDNTEEWISQLENRVVKITQAEQKKKKK